MTNLELVAHKLTIAVCPEEVFGTEPDMMKAMFRSMLKVVHPDHNDGNQVAVLATERLNRLKAIADARMQDGTWGKRLVLPEYETIELAGIQVVKTPTKGDLTDVYLGKTSVVKVVRSSDDNDLMRAERTVVQLLNAKITTVVKDGVPVYTGATRVGRREVSIFRRASGFVTAEEVHRRMPHVDARTLVWMFKRVLSVLDWAHHLGWVHGAILPPHVMFHPDGDAARMNQTGHTARIVDWCYAVPYKERTRLSGWVPAWQMLYAPELLAKESVDPTSDIYMAACLVQWLHGGARLPDPLHDVLTKCSQNDPAKRYQNIGDVFVDWTRAARAVYGEPKWVEFNLPQ